MVFVRTEFWNIESAEDLTDGWTKIELVQKAKNRFRIHGLIILD